MLTWMFDLNESIKKKKIKQFVLLWKNMVQLRVQISDFNVWHLVINPKMNFNDFLGIENIGL